MPIDPRMSITTPVTDLLGINHPILLAPMDLVADGRLVAAVDAAGGFGRRSQAAGIVVVLCLVKFFNEPVKLLAVLLTERAAVRD
jgi:NAD(P)H-dependent flavin oxidoreductase YrpB (nitropropane dioxygenase family)